MMKKVWLILLAVVLVFGLAVFGCSSGGGSDDDDDELVEKVIFDLATDAGIQALEVGALSFADDANPIKPLVRAGGDSNVSFEAVDNDGKIALKFTVGSTTNWGAGFDMRFGPGDGADGFGFRVGDNIKVSGELITIGSGDAPSSGDRRLDFNRKVGSEYVTIGGVEAKQTEVGAFSYDMTLTEEDLTDIKGGNPAGIRAEGRSGGMVVRIDNITITGMRPSNIKALKAPVIAIDGSVISWAEIEGAGGYLIYNNEDETPLATTLNTSYDLASLAPGDYSITVAAKGVAGSSKDSPKSNAVAFTKVAVALPAGYTEIYGDTSGKLTWYSNGCDSKVTTLTWDTLKAAKYLILKVKSQAGQNGIGGLQLAVQSNAEGSSFPWHDAMVTDGWQTFSWLATGGNDDYYIVVDLTSMSFWTTVTGTAGTQGKIIINSDNSEHVAINSTAYLVASTVTLTMPGTNADAMTGAGGTSWAAKVVAGL